MIEIECDNCNDEGFVEEMGDGDNFECDVVGVKRCPECNDCSFNDDEN